MGGLGVLRVAVLALVGGFAGWFLGKLPDRWVYVIALVVTVMVAVLLSFVVFLSSSTFALVIVCPIQ